MLPLSRCFYLTEFLRLLLFFVVSVVVFVIVVFVGQACVKCNGAMCLWPTVTLPIGFYLTTSVCRRSPLPLPTPQPQPPPTSISTTRHFYQCHYPFHCHCLSVCVYVCICGWVGRWWTIAVIMMTKKNKLIDIVYQERNDDRFSYRSRFHHIMHFHFSARVLSRSLFLSMSFSVFCSVQFFRFACCSCWYSLSLTVRFLFSHISTLFLSAII